MSKKIHSHVSIDLYAYRSGMGGWNPFLKMIFTIVALIAVIGTSNLRISAMTFLFMLVLAVGVGRIPPGDYIRLLLVPAAFILLGALAILIQFGTGNEAVWKWQNPLFGVYITLASRCQSMTVVLKSFAAVSVLYMLSLSTPVGEILQGMKRLHIPGIILDLMHLIYRYIFILADINHKQKEAARARLGYRDFQTSFHTFARELSNLLILSMQKSGAYYDAMEARGYDGTAGFWEEKKPVTAVQVFIVGVYVLLVVLCMVLPEIFAL